VLQVCVAPANGRNRNYSRLHNPFKAEPGCLKLEAGSSDVLV
jgi:hypothetical protein